MSRSVTNDLWRFDGGDWRLVAPAGPDAPPARLCATLAHTGDALVLMGGWDGADGFFDDVWTFQRGRVDGSIHAARPAEPPRRLHASGWPGRGRDPSRGVRVRPVGRLRYHTTDDGPATVGQRPPRDGSRRFSFGGRDLRRRPVGRDDRGCVRARLRYVGVARALRDRAGAARRWRRGAARRQPRPPRRRRGPSRTTLAASHRWTTSGASTSRRTRGRAWRRTRASGRATPTCSAASATAASWSTVVGCRSCAPTTTPCGSRWIHPDYLFCPIVLCMAAMRPVCADCVFECHTRATPPSNC